MHNKLIHCISNTVTVTQSEAVKAKWTTDDCVTAEGTAAVLTLSYLVICRCFLRSTSRNRTSRLMSRMLRTARAEMAATLGFISLAADIQTDAQTDVVTSQHSPLRFHQFSQHRTLPVWYFHIKVLLSSGWPPTVLCYKDILYSLVNTCYDKVLTNELAAPLWLTAPKRFTESLQAAGKSSLSSAPQHKSSSCHTHPQWLQFTLLPAGVTKNILNLQIKELHLVQFSLLRCFRAQIKTVTALLRCR